MAGLGQALVVIGLAAGAGVARWTEAVEGAGGIEAGATVFTGTGALLCWEERRAGSQEVGPEDAEARLWEGGQGGGIGSGWRHEAGCREIR